LFPGLAPPQQTLIEQMKKRKTKRRRKVKSDRPKTVKSASDPFDQAVENLGKIIAQAIELGHSRSAIAAQKELDRLVGLQNPAGNRAGDVDAAVELDEVRGHLVDLVDNAVDLPTGEIARLVALKFLQM
jgi:hypothetical protein